MGYQAISINPLVLQKFYQKPLAKKLAQRYADEGAVLRREAEQQAASGQFETAIATMEEANKRLVRSLQMMGLSIPG